MFNINLTKGSVSQSVWTLKVNPFTGTAKVRWFASPLTEYRHTGVSRRAILGLMIGRDRSYGQWVNYNCLQSHETNILSRMWREISTDMADEELAQASA
tara:strand:- start:310 stop:606 length:297 start_codon:yes stop_codon:yes gene_type:complete